MIESKVVYTLKLKVGVLKGTIISRRKMLWHLQHYGGRASAPVRWITRITRNRNEHVGGLIRVQMPSAPE